VVFVHGFLGEGVENHRMFIRVAERFVAAGMNCVLFDQKGCGYSDGDYEDVCLSDMRADLEAVAQWARRQVGSIIGLFGQSVGTALCLESAQTHPERYRFVIGLNPVPEANKWMLSRYHWDLRTDVQTYLALPKGIYVSRELLSDLVTWDWIASVYQTRTPTLLLAGTDDDLDSVATAKVVAARLGEMASLVELPGGTHSFVGQRELESLAVDSAISWLIDGQGAVGGLRNVRMA